MNPLAANLLAFLRGLRELGFAVGPEEHRLAVQALALFDEPRRQIVHDTLASVFIKRSEDQKLFDLAFDQFFLLLEGRSDPKMARETFLANVARQRDPAHKPSVLWAGRDPAPSATENVQKLVTASRGASPDERLQEVDFAQLTPQEARHLQHLPVQVRPHWRVSRRLKPAKSGAVWDVAGTLKKGMRGGEVLELWMKKTGRRQRPTVALVDISGSMEPYARMILHFFHGLYRERFLLEVFTFSTRLTRVTPAIAHYHVERAMAAVARKTPDYAGGTRLAGALDQFVQLWAARAVRPGADILIISDGLDAGPVDTLDRALHRVKVRAHRLFWWNPLAGRPGYRPSARGPEILLRVSDRMYPAATWRDLIWAWQQGGQEAVAKH